MTSTCHHCNAPLCFLELKVNNPDSTTIHQVMICSNYEKINATWLNADSKWDIVNTINLNGVHTSVDQSTSAHMNLRFVKDVVKKTKEPVLGCLVCESLSTLTKAKMTCNKCKLMEQSQQKPISVNA